MTTGRSTGTFVPLALAVLAVAGGVQAQTPAERARMEYEQQQREYWRAQEAQREAERRQQQLNEYNRRQGQSPPPTLSGGAPSPGTDAPSAGSYGGGNAAGAAVERARRELAKQPPLAADRNKLLGRWKLDTSKKRAAGAANDFAALFGGGNVCEMIWGTSPWEFHATQLAHKDAGGNMVIGAEYRAGNGGRVAVLPKEFIRLLVFEFQGPDRVKETLTSGAGPCEFVRVGAAAGR